MGSAPRKVYRALFVTALGMLAAVSVTATSAGASDEIVDAPKPPRDLFQFERRETNGNRTPAGLDEIDATAALEGIGLALTEVGDGSTYVWHRRDGLLSGMAQPTASFKDAIGRPCRHLIVMLNTYGRSSRIEGVACRTLSGRWQLDG